MREILFRGKSLGTGEWVEGYYAELGVGDDVEYFIIQNMALVGLFKDPEMNKSFSDIPVDPDTVGQWTGLVDKNGVKIFEGDGVSYKHTFIFHSSETLYEHMNDEPETIRECLDVIKYSEGKFTPIPYRYDCDDYYYSHADFDFEVIGNIYDNPELVKK